MKSRLTIAFLISLCGVLLTYIIYLQFQPRFLSQVQAQTLPDCTDLAAHGDMAPADCIVNIFDFNVLVSNFGKNGNPPPLPSAMPTPLPANCRLQQVQCIQPPCNPVVICDPTPTIDEGHEICGNGIIEETETCDVGNACSDTSYICNQCQCILNPTPTHATRPTAAPRPTIDVNNITCKINSDCMDIDCPLTRVPKCLPTKLCGCASTGF